MTAACGAAFLPPRHLREGCRETKCGTKDDQVSISFSWKDQANKTTPKCNVIRQGFLEDDKTWAAAFVCVGCSCVGAGGQPGLSEVLAGSRKQVAWPPDCKEDFVKVPCPCGTEVPHWPSQWW